jgi:hypothetical protein
MSRRFLLKDGTEVVIRPMTARDVDRSFAFSQSLTPGDRLYLRHDVTRLEEVENRIRAMEEGRARRLVARRMRPQIAARSIFRKLGFRDATLVPDYVKDADGKRQDLVPMRCDLEGLWQKLDRCVSDRDWMGPD